MPSNPVGNPILDERWLRRASWWVSHRHQVWLLFVGLLAAADGVAIVYSIYPWVDYLWLGRDREAALHRSLSTFPDTTTAHAAFAPAPILTIAPAILPGSGASGSYDVLVKFVNPNPDWAATLTYSFAAGDGQTEEQQTFILNDEERFVIGTGVASSSGSAPAVTLTRVDWQRIRNPNEFNARKPHFVVSDVSLTPARDLGVSGRLALSRIRFTVTNESALSFWSVGFTVVLLRGDRPIAARYITLEQVRSSEEREVTVNLFTSAADAGTVLVVPEVNLLDPRSIMPVSGESSNF